MSFRDSPFGEVKVPLAWMAAVALIVAIVVAIALLVSDRRETFKTEAYGVTREVTDMVATPVSGAVAAPGRWSGLAMENVQAYFFAVSENRRLKAEVKDLRQWRDVAIALRDTNERYRAVLGLKTDPPIPMVTARVVTDSRGPFANTRLINAGQERGVVVGNPVRPEIAVLPAPTLRYAQHQGPLRVLVVGGSLGAQALNEVVPKALALRAPASLQLVQSTR